jgi:hypothetical protein
MDDDIQQYAIILTKDDIEYMLNYLELVAETDTKMDKILQKFDEACGLDINGEFITHP